MACKGKGGKKGKGKQKGGGPGSPSEWRGEAAYKKIQLRDARIILGVIFVPEMA